MKHNHEQNLQSLKKKEQELTALIKKTAEEQTLKFVQSSIEKYKSLLSKAIIVNETTKEEFVFFIPLEIVATQIKNGIECSFMLDSKVGAKILSAAWKGTGISINPEIISYVEEITGKHFEDQFPEITNEEAEIDPDKLSVLYFHPTYADIIFSDAIEIESREVKIDIKVK